MFLLLQTNHIHRIHTHTILHNLKMQVETCAVAGIAYITYNLPCRYRFPCGNGSLRHKDIITSHSFCVSLCRYFLIPSHISLDSTLSSIGFIRRL